MEHLAPIPTAEVLNRTDRRPDSLPELRQSGTTNIKSTRNEDAKKQDNALQPRVVGRKVRTKHRVQPLKPLVPQTVRSKKVKALTNVPSLQMTPNKSKEELLPDLPLKMLPRYPMSNACPSPINKSVDNAKFNIPAAIEHSPRK